MSSSSLGLLETKTIIQTDNDNDNDDIACDAIGAIKLETEKQKQKQKGCKNNLQRNNNNNNNNNKDQYQNQIKNRNTTTTTNLVCENSTINDNNNNNNKDPLLPLNIIYNKIWPFIPRADHYIAFKKDFMEYKTWFHQWFSWVAEEHLELIHYIKIYKCISIKTCKKTWDVILMNHRNSNDVNNVNDDVIDFNDSLVIYFQGKKILNMYDMKCELESFEMSDITCQENFDEWGITYGYCIHLSNEQEQEQLHQQAIDYALDNEHLTTTTINGNVNLNLNVITPLSLLVEVENNGEEEEEEDSNALEYFFFDE